MTAYPIFLSVVCVLRNQGEVQQALITEMGAALAPLVSDYELIIVDNASTDHSVAGLKALTAEGGLPNLQVYALTKEVAADTAAWAGLENALGDFVAVIDPLTDDIAFLPQMLDRIMAGMDVIFAHNRQETVQSPLYRASSALFTSFYRSMSGIDLSREAPVYRLLSKRVVHFILQHPQPALTYRYLSSTAGFATETLNYSAPPRAGVHKRLGESVDRSIKLLVSTTRAPMRLVTTLSLFGAAANIVYSVYVVAVGLFKSDVAPGWVSLSLQQSGMFFLISLTLLVLGEYILNMVRLSNEGPLYHVAQELTSARLTRRDRRNVEAVLSPPPEPASTLPTPEYVAHRR